MSAAGRSEFVYVTYIRTTRERLWAALTEDTEFMKQYWFGTHCESAWAAGSAWRMVQPNGNVSDAGEIVEVEPQRRLVIRWQHQNPELKGEGFSICTMEIEQSGSAVKLSIRHTIDREGSTLIEKVSGGWPKILSNLKSLLETGAVALVDAYTKAETATSPRDYTTTIHASTSAKRAVEAIDQVAAWWTTSFQGAAQEVGDTFNVHFGDTVVAFEVVEHADDRIVWHVTDSLLPWLRDKSEWTGTDVVWRVAVEGRETSVQMTHKGLVPTVECYANCERGWDFYVGKSLRKLLGEGEGLPDGRKREHA